MPDEIVYNSAKRKNTLPNGISTFKEFMVERSSGKQFSDLADFVKTYYNNLKYLCNDKQTIHDMIAHFCKSQTLQGIYYTELRLTPVCDKLSYYIAQTQTHIL